MNNTQKKLCMYNLALYKMESWISLWSKKSRFVLLRRLKQIVILGSICQFSELLYMLLELVVRPTQIVYLSSIKWSSNAGCFNNNLRTSMSINSVATSVVDSLKFFWLIALAHLSVRFAKKFSEKSSKIT